MEYASGLVFCRGDDALRCAYQQILWSLPAEERIASAAGLNEVRYGEGDDDRRAAELLAADLRALGRSAVRARQEKGIRPKTPEIWISI